MKFITFAVPCYNSQEYLERCVDSLLAGGDDVEIIIVNDGSSDATLRIAEDYRARFPSIVKVIDKPNGGHGSGVNAGLNAATGVYYKVVDSDDRLDSAALLKLIDIIKVHCANGCPPDTYVTNFVYDKASDNSRFVSSYKNKIPAGEICGWDKVKKFRFSHMLLMHSLIYKRETLLKSRTVLPEHTFYVDNIFAYKPLPYMRTLYYADLNLYYYFIGREDQSVNRKNFVKRYAQQIRVMREMIDAYTLKEIKTFPKGLKKYMLHALAAIMMNTVFFTCAECSEERKLALKELWQYIKRRDKKLYDKLRYRSYTATVNWLSWRMRGRAMSAGYNILCKKIKLG